MATEADDKNDVDKFSKRLVRVTRDHNEDCKKLLSLMGVPVVTVSTYPCVFCFYRSREVTWQCLRRGCTLMSSTAAIFDSFCAFPDFVIFSQAPSEAEAQCAALAREGVVYGTATEDMDALTFQTPKLLRRMTFSGSNQPILEVDYQKLLQVSRDYVLLLGDLFPIPVLMFALPFS